MNVAFRLAWRTFRHARTGNRQHLRGAILGVGLSLVPLIVVLIVADGMILGITGRYIELKTYHLRVYPGLGAASEDLDEMARRIAEVDRVRHAFVETQAEGLMRSSAGSTGVSIRGVDPGLYALDYGFREYLTVESGEFDLRDPSGVVVGQDTARALGLEVGDRVMMATVSLAGAGDGNLAVPRIGSLKVTGIFSTGYQELDKHWVFVSREQAERLVSPGRREDFVGVKVADPFGNLAGLAWDMRRAAGRGARVFDWYQLEMNEFRSFEVTRNLLLFVMVLIVVVGAVNVSSAVVMIVLEKVREIGILKSMGASPTDISRAFVLVGLMAGAAGALVGVALGLFGGVNINHLFRGVELVVNAAGEGVAAGVRALGGEAGWAAFELLNCAYYLEEIPVRIELLQMLIIGAGTVGLCALASAVPARRAGRIRPLDVIRRH